MLRTLNVAEKNVRQAYRKIVNAGAATSTLTLQDDTKSRDEICSRYIQNCTGGELYYAIGRDVSAADFDGILVDRAQLDCSQHCLPVYVWPANTGNVTVNVFIRERDNVGFEQINPNT